MAESVVATDRLILRAWREEDIDPFHAMCSDPEVMAYLGPASSRAEIEALIIRQNGFQASLGYCFWAMERRADNAMIGFCGLKPGPEDTPLEGRAEIGWRLRRDAWGQGFAREAAQASLDWGWANLDSPDDGIWAITVLANRRSWGLMERLGKRRHPELDFDYPGLRPDDPLRRHICYSATRPSHG